jgi:hypothetical protein
MEGPVKASSRRSSNCHCHVYTPKVRGSRNSHNRLQACRRMMQASNRSGTLLARRSGAESRVPQNRHPDAPCKSILSIKIASTQLPPTHRFTRHHAAQPHTPREPAHRLILDTTSPPRLVDAPPQATIHLYPARHSLRRQHFCPAHHQPATRIPQHERCAQQPDVEP